MSICTKLKSRSLRKIINNDIKYYLHVRDFDDDTDWKICGFL
jgi:hypothetical protein